MLGFVDLKEIPKWGEGIPLLDNQNLGGGGGGCKNLGIPAMENLD